MADDQLSYESFQQMKPPQFQGGKGEDAYEFLTLCHEMLEVVCLADPHGVRFMVKLMQGKAMIVAKTSSWTII